MDTDMIPHGDLWECAWCGEYGTENHFNHDGDCAKFPRRKVVVQELDILPEYFTGYTRRSSTTRL